MALNSYMNEGSYPLTAWHGPVQFLQSIWRLLFPPSVKMCYFMCSDYYLLPCLFREHLFLVRAANLLSHNLTPQLGTWPVCANQNLPWGFSQDLEGKHFLSFLGYKNMRSWIPGVSRSQRAEENRATSGEQEKWEMTREPWCACSST